MSVGSAVAAAVAVVVAVRVVEPFETTAAVVGDPPHAASIPLTSTIAISCCI